MGVGIGDAIHTADWLALLMLSSKEKTQLAAPSKPSEPAAAASTTATESWVPNWRQLGVGFGAGALVALLLGMQIRQMGRGKG
jgi:hypothetical protein